MIGNPNTGKTTLFNALTGLAQQIGNYPGVTVERKSGAWSLPDGQTAELLDLPGTYSLAARSPDEMIAVDILLGGQNGDPDADAAVVIVDASNLRRNLYLLSQLLEVQIPIVVALNMVDIAESRRIHVDAQELSSQLGVPVVPLCANRRQGLEPLATAVAEAVQQPRQAADSAVIFPPEVAELVARLTSTPDSIRPFEALRALIDEGGHVEERLIQRHGVGTGQELAGMRKGLHLAAPLTTLETELRYAWIDGILEECMQHPQEMQASASDRIDRVLTHRYIGVLIFLSISAFVFQSIYRWAAPLMNAIDSVIADFGTVVGTAIPAGALRSLVVDGIVAGVGAVFIFLPQIAILFLFVAVMEDCGYMARAALLMDRLLTRCGLSGKSFLPLLSSFACAIPGVMATRTIEDRRDRLATMMVAPLMSCSARLPVYVLLIAAFIPERPLLGNWFGVQGFTLLAMYSVGVVVAVPVAWLLKKTLLKGDPPPFLLELPSYKWPSPQTVGLRVYHNSKAFVLRAGTIIMATTIVMWALAYFPRPQEIIDQFETQRTAIEESAPHKLEAVDQAEAAALLEASYLGRAGRAVEPLVRPLGWDWRIGMATLASFPAREIIISVLGTIYSLGGEHDEESGALRQALQNARHADGTIVFTVPVALSIMVFFALCAQCMSTLAVIQRETQSWRWPAFTFAYMTALAYIGSWATFQLMSRLL